MISIVCELANRTGMFLEHRKCQVAGCECDCHAREGD